MKQPDQPEEHIILRSIKDVNLPKFLADDVKLFNDILLDLFPGVELESYKYDAFSRAMKNSFASLELDFIEEYAEKIMQVRCQQTNVYIFISFYIVLLSILRSMK